MSEKTTLNFIQTAGRCDFRALLIGTNTSTPEHEWGTKDHKTEDSLCKRRDKKQVWIPVLLDSRWQVAMTLHFSKGSMPKLTQIDFPCFEEHKAVPLPNRSSVDCGRPNSITASLVTMADE